MGGGWRRGFQAVSIIMFAAVLPAADDCLLVSGGTGTRGGRLVATTRFEPRTLNWVVANDAGSKELLSFLMADLIHINRLTQKTEPALAKSWTVSPDGLHWNLELRRDVLFSDGHPFDADDVVFTFQVILDEKMHSPQRDLLMLDGKPIAVRKTGAFSVAVDLPERRAVADRLFDGVYMLPRHKLETVWKAGKLADAWTLADSPSDIVGLGPFRMKSYIPGQEIALERNPHYWKRDALGARLPYLDEVKLIAAGTEDNQVLRFQSGESDVLNRVSAKNFAVLERESAVRNYRLRDAGPGMEASYLVFNLGEPRGPGSAEIAAKRTFLQRTSFRLAVASAIDRAAIVRLVYQGRATALGGPVAAGNRAWMDSQLPPPARSLERARQLLAADGFRWKQGALLDPSGRPVEFSILVSNTNSERQQMASLIQEDLKPLGMNVHQAPMDFHSIGDRVQNTHQFEAAILSLATPDADPNPDLAVYLSSGGNHLWNAQQKTPSTPWEAEIDRLMRKQQVALKYEDRKRLFDRVQEVLTANQPMIPLVSPDILVGAKNDLGNFQPALLEPYTLWNIEQLYWHNSRSGRGR
jgi:peptide/nickel transport system substrate-binding protein